MSCLIGRAITAISFGGGGIQFSQRCVGNDGQSNLAVGGWAVVLFVVLLAGVQFGAIGILNRVLVAIGSGGGSIAGSGSIIASIVAKTQRTIVAESQILAIGRAGSGRR